MYSNNDEIDLKELWLIVIKYKKIIALITLCITLSATIIVFMITPKYEAKALIEVGDYRLDNGNNGLSAKIPLDQGSVVEKKINTLFIDAVKNTEKQDFEITSFSLVKGQTQLLEIKAEARSNALAIEGINHVMEYIQRDHQKILDDILKQKKVELENVNATIKDVNEKQIAFIEQKISLYSATLIDLEKSLKTLNENLKNIESLNPSLAALKLMEKRNIADQIVKLNSDLVDLEKQKNALFLTTLRELESKKRILESVLAPHNYKNTQVVEKIITEDKPSKPKKLVIIVMAIMFSFMLSIFIIFIMEMFKKKE